MTARNVKTWISTPLGHEFTMTEIYDSSKVSDKINDHIVKSLGHEATSLHKVGLSGLTISVQDMPANFKVSSESRTVRCLNIHKFEMRQTDGCRLIVTSFRMHLNRSNIGRSTVDIRCSDVSGVNEVRRISDHRSVDSSTGHWLLSTKASKKNSGHLCYCTS